MNQELKEKIVEIMGQNLSNREEQADQLLSLFSQLLAEKVKEIEGNLNKNLLGGFIAESKTDDNEKLWVRIDNYFGESPSGEIILIDRKKLAQVLSVLKEKR